MSDVIDIDSTGNLVEFSVSELSGSIKRTVETAFDHVRVRGEISGYRGPHSSGHAYFALKDDRARIDAVIWKGNFSKLRFRPEEGMEVIATGKITTFPGSSKYQIVIENLEPAGAGALMALLEERRRRLAAEGLFDQGRKRQLPFMPGVIGVVTSPTGAVIRDILHRILDRFPVHVVVWPVRVQGEGSGEEVARAIAGFNALGPDDAIARPDVLIVARGGGSLEDLWSFNDESVVRAAAASTIPLISAVGHETDWTLIDHAADVRAPTPTGAAEMAVPVRAELEARLATLTARLSGAASRHMEQRRQGLRALARALPSLDQLLALPRRRFDEAAGGLTKALELNTINKRRHYERASSGLRPETLAARLAAHRQLLAQRILRIDNSAARLVLERRSRIMAADTALRSLPPRLEDQLRHKADRLGSFARQMDRSVDSMIQRQRSAASAHDRVLQSLSYRNVLNRGFAVIRDSDNHPVTRASQIVSGMALSIQLADGDIQATAGQATSHPPAPETPAPTQAAGAPARRKAPGKPSGKDKPDQGSLF